MKTLRSLGLNKHEGGNDHVNACESHVTPQKSLQNGIPDIWKDVPDSLSKELLKVRVYHSLKLASSALLHVSLAIIFLRFVTGLAPTSITVCHD